MKKVIKRGLDLILCAALISSISFCFAWSDVSQYADTDVMEMSLSDLASLRTVDSRIKDQLSETQQDYDFLLQYSSSSAMLNEWTVYSKCTLVPGLSLYSVKRLWIMGNSGNDICT